MIMAPNDSGCATTNCSYVSYEVLFGFKWWDITGVISVLASGIAVLRSTRKVRFKAQTTPPYANQTGCPNRLVEKEEIEPGDPFFFEAGSYAYLLVVLVIHCSVRSHRAHFLVVLVANLSIGLDQANFLVVLVANLAIGLNQTNFLVILVTNLAIGLEGTYCLIVFVTDFAIRIDPAHFRVCPAAH